MPLVSVVIPNYNHAAYLGQRIGSVLNQTFRDIEVIILDDCSTDNSRDIIERYGNNPLISHIVYNEENSGSVFKQWKKGIELAQGRYIWIAESDDWCENNLLETLAAGLKDNANCVLAYCQSYCVTGADELMWASTHKKLSETLNGREFIRQYLVEKNTIHNASMALFKKEAFGKAGKEYLDFRFAGDWLFWAGIAAQGNVFISGRVLNYFRKHAGDVTSRVLASGFQYAEETEVLQLLKTKEYIPPAVFEKQLLKNYFCFLLAKRKYNPADAAAIETAYYKAAPESVRRKMKRLSIRYGITLTLRRMFSK